MSRAGHAHAIDAATWPASELCLETQSALPTPATTLRPTLLKSV